MISALASDAQNTSAASSGTELFAVLNFSADVDHVAQYQAATGANTVYTFISNPAGTEGWAINAVAIKGQ